MAHTIPVGAQPAADRSPFVVVTFGNYMSRMTPDDALELASDLIKAAEQAGA